MRKAIIALIIFIFLSSGCIVYKEEPQTPHIKNCAELVAEIPSIIAEAQSYPAANVSRIIDGDTVELSDAGKVRLIGINTPEKNERYYEEAKENLELLVLDRQVFLEKDISDEDKYGRKLRYIFTTDKFVNAEQVSGGFASSYEYLPDTKYQQLFNCLEKEAKSKGTGIWKGTGLYDFAVEIFQNPDDSSEPNLEYIALTNRGPSVNMNGWQMKDEATHIYTFGNVELGTGQSITVYSGKGIDTPSVKYWKQSTTVWNNDGDTVFLRDADGNLALAYEY